MRKGTKTTGLCCLASLLVFTHSAQAQGGDHYIENQRYVVGIEDFSWGDTYVGMYTSSNALILVEHIENGETNPVTLQVSSLQIGSETNMDNLVYITTNSELQIAEDFVVQGTNNGNGLLIDDKGSLFVKSDFDASMGGFYYNSGAQLKVGGEVSNLDNVEGGLNFFLTGENATWNFGTNLLTIGALTDANSVSISNGATLDIDYITVGSPGTTGNRLVVTDKGRMAVREGIDLLGAGNSVHVTNDGVLAVYFDFDTHDEIKIGYGGILEAHKDLIAPGGITNGGGIIMTGPEATWTNLSGATLNIDAAGGETDYAKQKAFLIVTNDATVRVGSFNIGDPNFLEETSQENEIILTDGGTLIVENGGTVADDGARLSIIEGGRLVLESNYNITGTISWYDGGIIEAQADFPVFNLMNYGDKYEEYGSLFLQNGQILILNGTNANWTANTNNLHVGDLSANNALIVTNGGIADMGTVSIGDFKVGNDCDGGGHNNRIEIMGSGSALYSASFVAIGGTLDLGIWIEGGTNNSITVGNGGLLSVGTTLHNRNTTGTCGLNIKPGGVVEAQDYHQANGAYLMVYTDAGTNAGLLSVTNTATFETGAQVGFDSVVTLEIGRTYTNRIVETDTLIVGGATNATTSDLDALDNIAGSLVSYDLWTTNQDIYATFTRRSISEGGGFDPGSMLDQIGDEIDRLAGLGNTAASNQVEILAGLGSDAERRRQLEQMYAYQLPTFMHNQGVFGGIDQIRARGSSFHGKGGTKLRPKGVAGPGPHAVDQGLQGWAKAYGSFGSHDEDKGSGFNDGYDAQTYGIVVGLDQSFGEWLFGIAGGYGGSNIEGDNGDESEAGTGYGILYTSYGTKEWFGDIVLCYGLSDIDNDSGTVFVGTTSSTEASHTALYVGGGKEYKDPDGSGALLRPLAGLQVSLYDQDAYTEKSTTAVGKDVDAYERWSYLSTLGAEMVLPKTGTKIDWETQLRAYWLHEFNDDEEIIDYTLVGSTQPGQFVLRSPEANVGQIGIGCVAKWENGLQLRADLDGQFSSDFYATTFSGALLYEF